MWPKAAKGKTNSSSTNNISTTISKRCHKNEMKTSRRQPAGWDEADVKNLRHSISLLTA